jgi:hypothetical protein
MLRGFLDYLECLYVSLIMARKGCLYEVDEELSDY